MRYILLLLILLVTGCGIKQPATSYSGIERHNAAIEVLAAQAVDILAAKYPPGYTSISIVQEKTSNFGLALENALRNKGFVINESNALGLSFIADTISNNQVYLSISLTDGFAFSCFYSMDKELVIMQGQAQYEDIHER